MANDTVGVGLGHINLLGLFPGGYLQTLDTPVDGVAVGEPPIQGEMRIRIGEVYWAIDIVQIIH